VLFNVNDKVRVRLTARGREILRQQREELYRGIGKKPPPHAGPKEDADGWSEWQLWELMDAFGHHVHLGCDVPFETTIDIPAIEPATWRDKPPLL
jgi:hypothetical protein